MKIEPGSPFQSHAFKDYLANEIPQHNEYNSIAVFVTRKQLMHGNMMNRHSAYTFDRTVRMA